MRDDYPDRGKVFPPRDVYDVIAYPMAEVQRGYDDYQLNVLDPGDEQSPGYRWGWCNNKRDHGGPEDGLSHIRMDFARALGVLGMSSNARH